MLPFLGGLLIGFCVVWFVTSPRATKNDSELYLATMCQGKVDGKPCTHLSLPDNHFCRQHNAW